MFFIFRKKYEEKKRIKIILSILLFIMGLLTIRVSYVQNKFNKVVTDSDKNNSINKEKISNYNYLLLDRNGRDLNNYVRKYRIFINGGTFSLNAKNQNLDELMSFNYVLTEEVDGFSINDIVKNRQNKTYEIGEEAFNKLKNIKELKGIYTYEYDEIEEKDSRGIEKVLMETKGYNVMNKSDNSNKSKNSLEMKVNAYVSSNIDPKEVFEKNLDGIYGDNRYELNKENNNIKLTLDKDYQNIVREVLGRDEYSEYSNIGVSITEAESGKILAMAQKNEYNPNLIVGAGGILGYEPGSTFKILTLEAAIKYLGTSLADMYICQGHICKADKIHGKISVERAMEVSCNDVFSILGNKVGMNKLIEFAKEQGYFDKVLGLDENTGMESSGALPGKGSTAGIAAIGQTILSTPLQVLATMSTITNNGIYIKPYIIDSIENQDGNTVEEFQGEKRTILSQEESKTMKNLLIKSVNDGSGVKAKIDGVEIGGKTGTAEAGEYSHGWFIGFFYIDNKCYNMVVFLPNMPEVDRKGELTGGGNSAAPIFREIVLELIKNK